MRSGVPIASSVSSARLGAPPCSGPDSAPIAADQAGGEVGAGGGDDAGGERRGVEAVVDGEIRYCSTARACSRRGLLAGEHVEVVGGVAAGRPAARPAPRPGRSRCSAASIVGHGRGAARARRRAAARRRRCRRPAGSRARAPSSDSAVRSPSSGPAAGARRWPAARARDRGGQVPRRPRSRRRTPARSAGVGQLALEHQVPDVLEAAAARPARRRCTGGSGRSPRGRGRRRARSR